MTASRHSGPPSGGSGKVVGVVLAAGFSSRMGALGLKPLLPLNGPPVIERAVSLLRDGGVDEVIAVLGHRAGEIAPAAERAGAWIVLNEDYAEGMFSSVLTAVRELGGRSEPPAAAAFLPTDCCLVRPVVVRELLRVHRDQPESVVKPTFRGEPGHPVILPAAHFPAVLGHDGREGLRGALAPLPCVLVPVWDRHTTWDMDTPGDYERAQRAAKRLCVPTPRECCALLEDVLRLPPQAVAHGAAVARVARLLACMINRSGRLTDLDVDLVTAGGLLHDIAKGRPDHEREGGRMLREMGLAEVAEVAESHRDNTLAPDAPLTEREVVYLADKLVYGPKLVTVEERFAEKLQHFAADPAEISAIRGRRGRALAMHERFAALMGESPYECARRELADDRGRVTWPDPDRDPGDEPAC